MDIKSKEIKIVPIGEIKPNPNNRNKHGQDQVDRLVEIIKYQGFRSPLVVSNLSGLLVHGHGRLLAAQRLGLQNVPVIYQDFSDDAQEYASMVSDNAISGWSVLDFSGINFDLPELGPDFDLNMLGIKDFNLDVSEKLEETKDLREDLNKKYILEVTFPNDMELADVRDDLMSRGYIVKEK